MSELNICVLGAGVIGLTTAIELQNEFRNATITLIADKFYEKTTSFVAPALFFPSRNFKGPTEDIAMEWMTTSFNHWFDFLTNNSGGQAGISDRFGYLFSNYNPDASKNRYIVKLFPGFRNLPQDELQHFNVNWKYGYSCNTLVIENEKYLSWATSKFLNGHGKMKGQRIDNLSQLVGEYDAVVNCTGIGARFLCHDMSLRPIRGQTFKVDAPWVDKFYFVDNADQLTYIVPSFEGVSLGATHQFDSFDETYNDVDELDIKKRCESILPELQDKKIIARRVGLRPYRNSVRTEYEAMLFNEKTLNVVHNYGHGGNGVTTAPGTAKYAVKLVRQILMKNVGNKN